VESSDEQKRGSENRTLKPKSKAPTFELKSGKQEHRSSKPEQYLPNWILNLLGQKKSKKDQETTNNQ
jgi:hypothetical protein